MKQKCSHALGTMLALFVLMSALTATAFAAGTIETVTLENIPDAPTYGGTYDATVIQAPAGVDYTLDHASLTIGEGPASLGKNGVVREGSYELSIHLAAKAGFTFSESVRGPDLPGAVCEITLHNSNTDCYLYYQYTVTAKEIPSVTVEGVSAPQLDVASNLSAIHVPENSPYTLLPSGDRNDPAMWRVKDSTGTLKHDFKFSAGNQYQLVVTYVPNPGCKMTEATAAPALPGATVVQKELEDAGWHVPYLYVVYDFGVLSGGAVGDQPLKEVRLHIKHPSNGMLVGDLHPFASADAGTHCQVKSAVWYLPNGSTPMKDSDVFQIDGKEYWCTMTLTADEGYYFLDHMIVHMNDTYTRSVFFPEGGRKTAEVSYGYTLPKESQWRLSFELNGGTMTPTVLMGTQSAAKVDLTKYVPTREGYTFAGWYRSKDLSGQALTSIDMSKGDCRLYAQWIKIPEVKPSAFQDVPSDAYFSEAVSWAVENGITGGTGNGTFSPNMNCSRAQMVTFLWRAAGSPEPKSSVNPFADVADNAYYTKAVLWAVENNITGGTGNGKFSPDMVCSRGQTVTFLWRARNAPKVEVTGAFQDVPAGAYYAEAVAWAVKNNVTSGTGNGKFSPNMNCTRAQIVTFLHRAMK